MSEILSCPFCGGEAYVSEASNSSPRWVSCDKCECDGPNLWRVPTSKPTREEIIAAWNHRHLASESLNDLQNMRTHQAIEGEAAHRQHLQDIRDAMKRTPMEPLNEFWDRVPAISINPDMATRDEVARLAGELMKARSLLQRAIEGDVHALVSAWEELGIHD